MLNAGTFDRRSLKNEFGNGLRSDISFGPLDGTIYTRCYPVIGNSMVKLHMAFCLQKEVKAQNIPE